MENKNSDSPPRKLTLLLKVVFACYLLSVLGHMKDIAMISIFGQHGPIYVFGLELRSVGQICFSVFNILIKSFLLFGIWKRLRITVLLSYIWHSLLALENIVSIFLAQYLANLLAQTMSESTRKTMQDSLSTILGADKAQHFLDKMSLYLKFEIIFSNGFSIFFALCYIIIFYTHRETFNTQSVLDRKN